MECFSVPALRTLVGECCYVVKAEGGTKKKSRKIVVKLLLCNNSIHTYNEDFNTDALIADQLHFSQGNYHQ